MNIQKPTSGYEEEFTSTIGLAVWTALWAGSLAFAKYGPTYLWDEHQAASWIAVSINVAIGIGWILAFARYLRGIDSVHRKIQQDALTITLGVGWICGFAYVVADAADLISTTVSLAMFPILMAVVYMFAVAVGYLRYR